MNNYKSIIEYLSRYTGVTVLFLLGIVSIYVVWNYTWPKYQEIQITRTEIESLNTKKQELTDYVAYLHKLETETLPLEEELVNYALPSENDVISLIVTYEGLAKTPDIDVSPFDLSPGLIQTQKKSESDLFDDSIESENGSVSSGGTAPAPKELEFSMEVETENPEVAVDFIGSIHQTRRLFTIKSLLWENPDKAQNSNNNTISLSLELGTYYYQGSPKISGSAALVNKGRNQIAFINALNSTTVYDALVLDSIEVGKDDLFVAGASNAVASDPVPAPVSEENSTTVEDTELVPVPTQTEVTPSIAF